MKFRLGSPGSDSSEEISAGYRAAIYGTTILFAVWYCIGLLFYLPNNGGSGLALPFNILSWCVMALVTLWLALTLPVGTFIARVVNPEQWGRLWLLPAGALLWSLPLAWSPSVLARTESLPHVAALWGLLGLLWLLRRMPSRALRLRHGLTVLWCGALLQSLLAFLQVTVFNHHGSFSGIRPYGIFQQVNVLSSFLATGLACVLFFRIFIGRGNKLIWLLAGFSTFFLPFMLTLLQSRAGGLGAVLAAAILSSVFIRSKSNHAILLRQWLLMLAGISLALLVQHGLWDMLSQQYFPNAPINAPIFTRGDTASSTHERLYILQTTWQLIKHHPWFGTGYGGFEAAFAHETTVSHGVFNAATLIHPHNELMFAWAEGGCVALAGVAMMIAGILSSLWENRGIRWCGAALLLPIAVHMNFEYPLYQSVPHGMALVILLSVVLPPRFSSEANNEGIKTRPRYRNNSILAFLHEEGARGAVFCIGLAVLMFMTGALQTQQALVALEQQDMTPLAVDENGTVNGLWNTYSLPSRIDYDRHVALLMRYNLVHDERLLMQFDVWAKEYLTRHNDPNIYISRIMIARTLTPEKTFNICSQAHLLWAQDNRFQCNP